LKGKIICVEGINGSGEGSNAKLLFEKFIKKGYKVNLISFPDYTTPIGLEIKEFLAGNRGFNSEVRQLLYTANRWERKKDIEKWREEGRIVIANRYIPSGLAYGFANGLKIDWMTGLEAGLPKPDLVIVIDIPVEVHFKRKVGSDIYELNGKFLEDVRVSYLKLAKIFNWQVINGDKPISIVADEVWKTVEKIL
jgi:dTMP kinase